MSTRFFTGHLRSLPIIALLVMTSFLTSCFSKDPSWNATDISGLMPELEFDLINGEGKSVSANDYSGQVRLLFFGYSSCPDICPTALQKLNKTVSGLPPELQNKVLMLFVSVDPKRDTPERLSKYVNFFGDDIVGLTGTEEQLRNLAKRYRTTFGYDEPDAKGNYNVSHSSAVYVFDRAGDPRLLVRSDLSAEEIRQDLVALAQEDF